MTKTPSAILSVKARALVAPIETELRRIGCYDGAARDWDAPEVRLSVAEYARYAKLSATPSSPDSTLLNNLKSLRDRVCPLECSSDEIAVIRAKTSSLITLIPTGPRPRDCAES